MVQGFCVILEKKITQQEADTLMAALFAMKGVLEVEPFASQPMASEELILNRYCELLIPTVLDAIHSVKVKAIKT